VYMQKIGFGSHRGEGVLPFNKTLEEELRVFYEEGEKCGTEQKNYQMQRFISNPLLLKGPDEEMHKFDFRIYMLIASTNPLILYYHDGFLRVSLPPYDVESTDLASLLTNTDIFKKTLKANKELNNTDTIMGNMTEEELRNFQMWNFTRLQNYLLSTGKIKDDTWLDTHLRFHLQQQMAHIGRMTQGPFLKRSNIYELFGIDFIFDDDLNLWFIECNSGPVLEGTSHEKELFITKMLRDHFEIMFGYLRSRMKRVILYVNDLAREIPEENIYFDGIMVPDYDRRKAAFDKLSKNYLEPEYEVGKENGWRKVIDEGLEGVARYAGFIPEECLEY